MPKVLLKHPAAMTREQAHNELSEGSTFFWVAVPATNSFKGFVRIGKQKAFYPLNVEIDVPYGEYILGCGTGRNALRRFFTVDMLGVKFK